MEERMAGKDGRAPRAAWLALSDLSLEQLREDAFRRYLHDQDDPPLALRHVMHVVLFEHLAEMRRAVRLGLLTERRARAAMASSFAQGYRAGLVVSYSAACGLPPDGQQAQAALRDLLGYIQGETEAAAPARSTSPASGRFAAGKAAAAEDFATFKAWLADTAAEEPSQGNEMPPGPRTKLQ